METNILELINTRRSHRKYLPQPLSETQLNHLLAAALASPSANNLQPWHFTVVQDQVLLDQVNQATRRGAQAQDNAQRSPRFADPAFHVFYHAPCVVFITTQGGQQALDCGIAVYGLALAAESLGLGSVILGLPRLAFSGPEGREIEKALRFPPGHSFVIAIALGYPDDTKDPPARDPGKVTHIR